jgi:TPR repeat protein
LKVSQEKYYAGESILMIDENQNALIPRKPGEIAEFGLGTTSIISRVVSDALVVARALSQTASVGASAGVKDAGEDLAEAARWCRLAAEQGVAAAQYDLGLMYANGEGVPQNYAEAVKWWLAASESRRDAQNNLGTMFELGHGVVQDYSAAVKWYRKAAEQGFGGAQHNLGRMYENGLGVPQDFAEAARWYRRAAELGYAEAQNNLGVLCQQAGQNRLGEADDAAVKGLQELLGDKDALGSGPSFDEGTYQGVDEVWFAGFPLKLTDSGGTFCDGDETPGRGSGRPGCDVVGDAAFAGTRVLRQAA